MAGDVRVEGTVEVAVGILAAILIIAGFVLGNSTLILVGLLFGGVLVVVLLMGSRSGHGDG